MSHHKLLNTIPVYPLLQRNVEFTRAAWRAGLRADQRHASQLREMEVSFPQHKREMTEVQLGNTKVLAGVQVELVEPLTYRPQHGFFHIRVRQCMHDRDGSRSVTQVKRVTRYLERLLKNNVLDSESLCVLAGRCVWALNLEVIVMNDDGNIYDVAAWASLCALQHFRRPELTIRGEEVTLHPPNERDPVPLLLHHLPFSFTFAITRSMSELQLEERIKRALGTSESPSLSDLISSSSHNNIYQKQYNIINNNNTNNNSSNDDKNYEDNEESETSHLERNEGHELIIVVDPTKEETAAAATLLTVAITVEGQVCVIEKREGCEITLEIIKECLRLALQLAPQVSEVMQNAMNANEERRRKITREQFLWAQTRTGVQSAPVSTSSPAIPLAQSDAL